MFAEYTTYCAQARRQKADKKQTKSRQKASADERPAVNTDLGNVGDHPPHFWLTACVMLAALAAGRTDADGSGSQANLGISAHALSTPSTNAPASSTQKTTTPQAAAMSLAQAEACVTNYKLKHSGAKSPQAGTTIAAAKLPTPAERQALAACRRAAAEARAILAGRPIPKTKMARWLERTQAEVAVAKKAWTMAQAGQPVASAPPAAKANTTAIKANLRALAKAGAGVKPSNGATGRPSDATIRPRGPLSPQAPTVTQAAALRAWAADRLEAMQVT